VYGQESIYNGWKRKYYLKYQTIIALDGIIAHLYELIEGCIYDSAVYRESSILEILDLYAYLPNGSPLQVYRDPVYGISEY
ncbi:hypothetical protein L873DRAFT_1673996, partial [Choiromyces venosus 120613-1]